MITAVQLPDRSAVTEILDEVEQLSLECGVGAD